MNINTFHTLPISFAELVRNKKYFLSVLEKYF